MNFSIRDIFLATLLKNGRKDKSLCFKFRCHINPFMMSCHVLHIEQHL